MKLAIKMNDNPISEPCPLCGEATNPNIGAEIMLADCDLVVCRECGNMLAPALSALLELASAAREFVLHEQDFGRVWQAMREPQRSQGLDWNDYESVSQ
jgi:ribosome-binding protein aMBF1 (putative translation factor)